MPRNRFAWFTLAILMILSLVISACGGGQATTQAPEATQAPAAETSAPAAGGKTVVTIAAGAVGQELELTKAAAQRYMDAHPDVTVNVLDTPDLVQDRLGLYLQFFEAQSSEVLKRLHGVTNLADAVGDVDLVIETVSEDLEIKKSVFSELDRLCPIHTILASNTSYLSITGLGSVTQRPDKVIGMHFFNPPDVNPLVEVAPGLLLICKRSAGTGLRPG